MDNLFDIVESWFSAGGAETVGDNVDSIHDYFNAQGVDLSQYSTEEIKDALKSAISFEGSSNADKISALQDDVSSLKGELRTANQNIDYYEREIRNFNEHTSNTYRSGCQSHLQQAVEKVAEVTKKINSLNSQINSLKS